MTDFEKIDGLGAGLSEGNQPSPMPIQTLSAPAPVHERTSEGTPPGVNDKTPAARRSCKGNAMAKAKAKAKKRPLKSKARKTIGTMPLRESLSVADIKTFCITNGISTLQGLKLANEDYWKVLLLNGWSQMSFWKAVKILLKLEPLPDGFRPKDCGLFFSLKELESLGCLESQEISEN